MSRESARRFHAAHRDEILKRQKDYYQAHRDEILRRQALTRDARIHGLAPDDWARLWTDQRGRCYLCSDPLSRGDRSRSLVVVDHDHRCSCGRFRSCRWCRRGLACLRCNVLIGMADDDPERLRRIADNLERAQKRVVLQPQLALFDLEEP